MHLCNVMLWNIIAMQYKFKIEFFVFYFVQIKIYSYHFLRLFFKLILIKLLFLIENITQRVRQKYKFFMHIK